jgi:hypothetical protein
MLDFTQLEVWKISRRLANNIYDHAKISERGIVRARFPNAKIGDLNPVNIAEGCGRKGRKDTAYFLYVTWIVIRIGNAMLFGFGQELYQRI